MFASYVVQDETPLQLGARDLGGYSEDVDDGSIAAAAGPGGVAPSGKQNERSKIHKTPMKLLQSELHFVVVLRDKESGKFVTILTQLPTFLQACRTTSGANIHGCLEEQFHTPLLEALHTKFKYNFDLSSSDRGSSRKTLAPI